MLQNSACRIVERYGRRIGGQGAVAFAQHLYDANRELAVKFFFELDAFRRERDLARVRVRPYSCGFVQDVMHIA